MNLTWFEKLLLRIFLPSFSEVDLIALLYPLILSLFVNISTVIEFIQSVIIYETVNRSLWEKFEGFFAIAVILSMILYFIYVVTYLAITTKAPDQGTRAWIIRYYYILVFFLTLKSFTVYVPFPGTENQILYLVNTCFHFYIVAKIIFGKLLLSVLEKKYPDIYIHRMNDTQISRTQWVLFIFLESLIFFYLQGNTPVISTIFLSWTYATLIYEGIIAFLRPIIISLRPAHHEQ